MQAMPDRISPASLRALRLRMCLVLRSPSGNHQAGQGESSSDAGGDSPVQEQPAPIRDRWFAERAHFGTKLSQSELEHGVRAGLLGSAVLMIEGKPTPPIGTPTGVSQEGNSGPADSGLGELSKQVNRARVVNWVNGVNR